MLKIIEDGETKYYDDYQALILNCLLNEKIKFEDITTEYIRYLETLKSINNKQLAEADYCLIENIKPTKQHKGKYNKDATYRYLVKYKRFETAPIGEELKKYIKDNNINLKGQFYQDLYLDKGE